MASTPASRQEPQAAAERMVSVSGATQLVLLLLALWTAYSGFVLTFVEDVDAVALGGGIESEAGRRLLGIHVLALAPVYALTGWNPRKFGAMMWLPYATQAGIVLATLWDMVANDLDFSDAGLSLVVAVIFLALLAYLWSADRRPAGRRPIAGQTPPYASTGPTPERR